MNDKIVHEFINDNNNNMCSFDPMIDISDNLPNASGLYMLCAKTDSAINMCSDAQFSYIAGNAILYTGISESQGLKGRDYRNHFKGTARNSTVRKSLGALFGHSMRRICAAGSSALTLMRRAAEVFDQMVRGRRKYMPLSYPAWVPEQMDMRLLAMDLMPESVYARLHKEEL